MAVYYTLEPIAECAPDAEGEDATDALTRPAIHTEGVSRCVLTRTDKRTALEGRVPVACVVSPEEFDRLDLLSEVSNDFLHSLVESESNFADVYADHTIGSFSVPDNANVLGPLDTFAFYKNQRFLIFADSTGAAEETLRSIANMGVMGADTTAHCLYMFMKQLLIDQIAYMASMEDEMEALEEDILEHHRDVDTATIMKYRRQSMRLSAYYEQIGTMAEIISDNENKLMTEEEARSFENISNFADRLASRGETLENYSLQLHELHQTRIDLAQNSIMQTLTVVTVIIAPLTLLTGWFGMNVPLPGIDYPFMWIVLLAGALLVTSLLILHFRRRKWL